MKQKHQVAAAFAAFALVLVPLLTTLAAPARADDQPPVNGKNSKIQISGTGWAVFRYKLDDEPTREAPANTFTGDVLPKDASSFDIDRVYLTADYMFNDRYTWETVLEADNFGGGANGGVTISPFMKKAYLRVKKPFGLANSSLKFGEFSHCMISFIEDIWGFRSVSKVPIDRYFGVTAPHSNYANTLSSTYVGIGMDGKVLHNGIEYDFDVVNEKPYNKVSADPLPRSKYKTAMLRLTLVPCASSPTLAGLKFTGYGQFNGKNPDPNSPVWGTKYYHDLWYGGMGSYQYKTFSGAFLWAQYVNLSDDNYKSGSSYVYVRNLMISRTLSAFASINLTANDRVFGRFDWYDPSIHTFTLHNDPSKTTYGIGDGVSAYSAGVAHTYVKGVRSIVDVEYDKFQIVTGHASVKPDVTLAARMELSL